MNATKLIDRAEQILRISQGVTSSDDEKILLGAVGEYLDAAERQPLTERDRGRLQQLRRDLARNCA